MLHKSGGCAAGQARTATQKLRIAAFSLLTLPLIECTASNKAIIPEPLLPNTAMTDTAGDFKCRFTPQYEMISFDSRDGSTHVRVNLDMPKGVDLARPILFSCQSSVTIVVTAEYLARSIGHDDAARGKTMLGTLGGKFYPQNMIVWDLKPLGTIIKADFFEACESHGNEVAVQTEDGKIYTINIDAPAKPAEEL